MTMELTESEYTNLRTYLSFCGEYIRSWSDSASKAKWEAERQRLYFKLGNMRDSEPAAAPDNAALITALSDALKDVVWSLEETAAYDDAVNGEDPGLLETVQHAHALLERVQTETHP